MKATALIAAVALVCGTAAYAEQDQNTTRSHDSARVEHQDHGSTGGKLRSDMHRLGEKTRNAFHRMGEKLHAKRDHADNTHAMGASGTSREASKDRQQRMDDAYADYHAKQDKNR